MCAPEAFIDRKEYTLPVPPKDDIGFKMWQASMAKKYPSLLASYDLLNKCWTKYHGQGSK